MRPEIVAALALTGTIAPGAVAAAFPASARPARVPLTSVEATRATIARAFALAGANDCTETLRLLDPMVSALKPGSERSSAQTIRLSCLGPAGRAGEMDAVQRELAAATPRNPYVRSMGVLLAASAGRLDDAAELLAGIAADDPATLALIPADSWRGIEQQLVEQGKLALRDKAVIALARADWQPADRPELRETLAQGAIQALLIAGQPSEASVLLDRVTMPELLTEMAVERVYQPLWPAIEARMGPAQARTADRFAAAQLDAFARSPDDPRTVRDAVRAFGLLGRYDDASQTAAAVTVVDGMDEDAVETVRTDAQSMQAAGRTSAAVARLEPFVWLDAGKTPVAAAAVVELAEMLDEAGRAADALGVARTALASDGHALSPWGMSWLRRTELCTLAALGRAVEAKEVGDLLKARTADNPAAAVEGLLCARRTDEAATIAIATLGTIEGASGIADQFQPDGANWISAPSRLRAMWATLLLRPDVKAAFEKRARLLPRHLWPAKAPRPIPRIGASGDAADDRASPTI